MSNKTIVTSMRFLQSPDGTDPRLAAARAIALLVAANQPFYPLYLYAIAGHAAWPAWLVLATTPFYAAIPFVCTRHPRLGRIMLPVIGVLNTVIAAKALGTASGVELFYLPCALCAMALTKPGEGWLGATLLALPALAYLGIGARLGEPLATLSSDELSAMVRLHAISVGGLIAYCGYLLRPAPR